ncbi:MAG: TolC family protein, partial [Limisphaerales bacterium]
ANVGSVREWEDPMFMIGGSVFSGRGMSPAQMGDLTYGISEKLPLWGTPGLNRRMARAEQSASEARASFQFQKLRRDVTKALFTTALDRQTLNIDEQDLTWLKTTAAAVDARYRAGQTGAGDLLEIQNKAAINTDQVRNDRVDLSRDRFDLNRLLGRPPQSPWPPLRLPAVAPAVPYSDRLLSLAIQREPQLKVLEREIEKARAAAELARRDRLPDISVGVQGDEYHGDGGFRSGMFTLSFPLPWGNARKYRKDYERELENEKAEEEDRAARILDAQEEIQGMTTDLDVARRQALLYQNEISNRAAQALADKLADWEAGRATLRDVLDARRDALDAQLMAARATAQQYQTLADLLLWTGQGDYESLTAPAHPADAQSLDK